MKTRKYWNVLVVDDEDDVHRVTDLSLKREKVYGAGLMLHHAHSAQEALELLNADENRRLDIAVALVDVVMEDDSAGLELCRAIREDLALPAMQLVLRTGQPGRAPPREIIDTYNISGYLTKMEASGDRLYLEVKNGINRFYTIRQSTMFAYMADKMRASGVDTPHKIVEGLREVFDRDWGDWQVFNLAMDFGEFYAGSGCFADRAAYEKIKGDIVGRAEQHFANDKDKLAWIDVPNRIARVDDYLVVQTELIGTGGGKVNFVLYSPNIPTGMETYLGPIWRLAMGFFGQAIHSASTR